VFASAVHVSALSSSTNKQAAVVVGGGPVGLATALTLSNPPHSYDVTVLEKASVEKYDPTKAYLYNVNPRGQTWMKENFPFALQKLKDRGSQGSMSRITIVPGDPEQPIPKRRKTVGTYDTKKNNGASNDGTRATTRTKEIGSEDEMISYWIPRHSMICLLEDEIQEQQSTRREGRGKIDLIKNRKFSNLEPARDGSLEVSVQDLETGTIESYSGNLIVAADGVQSSVRKYMPCLEAFFFLLLVPLSH